MRLQSQLQLFLQVGDYDTREKAEQTQTHGTAAVAGMEFGSWYSSRPSGFYFSRGGNGLV
jgi:hypothetical protein